MINIMKAGLVGLALYSQGAFGEETQTSNPEETHLQTTDPIEYKSICETAKTKALAFERFTDTTQNPCKQGRTTKKDREECDTWVEQHNTKHSEAYETQQLCFQAINSHVDVKEFLEDNEINVNVYNETYTKSV